MKYINYYNHKIAYNNAGKGTTLVFLHGFGEDQRMWHHFTPFFKDFQVITIDFPGSGASENMEASIFRMAKIVNSVMEKEGISKSILIGHSMGGYVSLAYAKLYPEKLLGYCLFHSQPNSDTEEKKAGRSKGVEFIQNHGGAAFFKGLVPKLFNANFLAKKINTVQQLIDWASEMSDQAVINQLKAMRDRRDNQDVLKASTVPVCFIIGNEDVAVPSENSLNQTHLPKLADIHILDGVGHMGQFEVTEKTVEILRNFIKFVKSKNQL